MHVDGLMEVRINKSKRRVSRVVTGDASSLSIEHSLQRVTASSFVPSAHLDAQYSVEMSNYQRGGVQMTGYRASATLPLTSAGNANGLGSSLGLAGVGASISYHQANQAASQQYSNQSRMLAPTVMDDYERT